MRRIFLLFCLLFLLSKVVYAGYLEEKAIAENSSYVKSGDYTDTWYSDDDYEVLEEDTDEKPEMAVRYYFNLSYPYWNETLESFTIIIEGHSDPGEDAKVYLHNYTSGNDDYVGTLSLEEDTDHTFTFSITSGVRNYVNESGVMELLITDNTNDVGPWGTKIPIILTTLQ